MAVHKGTQEWTLVDIPVPADQNILTTEEAKVERHGFAVDPENCNVTHVRKGKQVEDVAKSKRDEAALVDNLKIGAKYKFLGVRESVMT